jgi:mRNA interferase RelE/StbE
MKVEFRKQFIANLKGIKNRDLANEIEYLIDHIETINNIDQIAGLKKMTGYNDYYRIRIEEYRIGAKLSGGTIIFV